VEDTVEDTIAKPVDVPASQPAQEVTKSQDFTMLELMEIVREKTIGETQELSGHAALPDCPRLEQVLTDVAEVEDVDKLEASKVMQHFQALHAMELAEAEMVQLSDDQMIKLKEDQQKEVEAISEWFKEAAMYWKCPCCTLLNAGALDCCKVCDTVRQA
jgi:hypothetical protein